jgi:predicted outer membrane repeat protein
MRSRMLPLAALILAGIAGWTHANDERVLYVDADATGPTYDGSSWCFAYTELHEALAVATPGTTIRVADGTYRPDTSALTNPREATFSTLSGVRLEGGYAGCGAADPDERNIVAYETVLSGDLDGDDAPVSCTENYPDCFSFGGRCIDGSCIIQGNNTENALHVVTATGVDQTAVLDGFTITAGKAENLSPWLCGGGGGMKNYSSPTLIDCTFFANSAGGDIACGAGMYNSGDPSLANCTFSRNSATGEDAYGGGIYNRAAQR